jgi:hypothetical protein
MKLYWLNQCLTFISLKNLLIGLAIFAGLVIAAGLFGMFG